MKHILFTTVFAFLFGIVFAQNEEPKKPEGYVFTPVKEIKHTSVKNQYRSGTCWSFSALSFIEAEVIRKSGKELDLSEMFVVYNAYAEKAQKFVRLHGKANFAAGGGFHDVTSCITKYGMIPEEAYKGIQYNEANHVHGELDNLLKALVEGVVENPNKKLSPVWPKAVNGVLAAYLGEIPEKFTYQGKEYTARTFADQVINLNMSDYIEIGSYTHHPFYAQFALEIEDNWQWDNIYNLPLDDMMKVIDNAIENGYTVAWGADVSEKGFSWKNGVAIVPEQEAANMSGLEKDKWEKMTKEEQQKALFSFDKPVTEKVITQENRQIAFDNYETTDDHGMLIVGTAKDQNGNLYYKIKNSWDVDQKYKGYFYASKAYVAYKTTTIMVNKESVPKDIKKKINL